MAGEGSFESYLFSVAALAVLLKCPVKTNIDFEKSIIHKMNRTQNVIDSN